MSRYDIGAAISRFGAAIYLAFFIALMGYFAYSLISKGVEFGFKNVLNDCTIKGNVSSNGEKIYHFSGQEYYNETIIEPDKGEKIFCSSEEAKKEGFRKSEADYTQEYLEKQRKQDEEDASDYCSGQQCL